MRRNNQNNNRGPQTPPHVNAPPAAAPPQLVRRSLRRPPAQAAQGGQKMKSARKLDFTPTSAEQEELDRRYRANHTTPIKGRRKRPKMSPKT